jgi:hypothetical protein
MIMWSILKPKSVGAEADEFQLFLVLHNLVGRKKQISDVFVVSQDSQVNISLQ